MRNIFRHISLISCCFAVIAFASCTQGEEPGKGSSASQRGKMTFTDEISTATKATPPFHVGHSAVSFDEGTQIQMSIDYSHLDVTKKYEYVHGVIFTKRPAPSNVFESEYSIVWLDDYEFDIYAVYPHDACLVPVTFPEEPEVRYSLMRANYAYKPSQCYADGDNYYVTTGATIYQDEDRTTPASDPHDLITSKVLSRETAPWPKFISFETKYTDHGEEPVGLQFMHRLSRLEPYFVNGMGESSENVYLQGIAIYPDVVAASFGARRHRWMEKRTQNLFRYSDDDGGWYHYDTATSSWETNLIENTMWPTYFGEAPIVYNFHGDGYKLSSTTAVMAQDRIEVDGNTVEPYVEFRMLPESEIDCMILHFKIENNDAYVPVRFRKELNQGRDPLTQMGHTTRVVLSYKATMITLLYVQYIDDWNPLPGRYVVGNLKIE